MKKRAKATTGPNKGAEHIVSDWKINGNQPNIGPCCICGGNIIGGKARRVFDRMHVAEAHAACVKVVGPY